MARWSDSLTASRFARRTVPSPTVSGPTVSPSRGSTIFTCQGVSSAGLNARGAILPYFRRALVFARVAVADCRTSTPQVPTATRQENLAKNDFVPRAAPLLRARPWPIAEPRRRTNRIGTPYGFLFARGWSGGSMPAWRGWHGKPYGVPNGPKIRGEFTSQVQRGR